MNVVHLNQQLAIIRGKIEKLKGGRGLNEQNTKAALITPLLGALGWDPTDPDEVHFEYRRRPKDNPVDYALMLQRSPCLFVEAKAFGQDLTDRKWTNQIINYATQSGISWIVLTNGVEYHIYNALAPVPLERKLFKKCSLLEDTEEHLLTCLSLLTRADFMGKRIDRVWDAHYVDGQVKRLIEKAVSPDEFGDHLPSLLAKLSDGALDTKTIRESLRRANIRIEFPPAPPEITKDRKTREEKRAPESGKSTDAHERGGSFRISVSDLLGAGLLRAPAELVSTYRKRDLKATLLDDGAVEFEGERFRSLSTAASMARKKYFRGKLGDERKYPQTNGWIFWRTLDPQSGELVPVDVIRRRLATTRSQEHPSGRKPSKLPDDKTAR